MKVADIFLSPEMNKLGLWIGEHTSPRVGYWIAKRVALALIRRKNSEQVRAVRTNQWVVSGKKLGAAALDEAVKKMYISSSYSLYDYYHYMRDQEAIKRLVSFDDNFLEFMDYSKSGKHGVLGLIFHNGGFDLAGYALAIAGMRPQILSYPHPNQGYQYHNELRKREGLNVTPLSMETLQQASRFLKNNGTVITGIDRPWAETRQHPMFFGERSDVPVTTIQLAIRTKVPVVAITVLRNPNGSYILQGSKFITMDAYADRDEELTRNTEKVLQEGEPIIRRTPEQWSMYYPVWPQFLNEMP
jgi:KDO2-lipid IV(A) lauroyltransferase